MDNISKIGASANFYVQNQSVKKENDSKKADEKNTPSHSASNESKDPSSIFDAMQMSAIQNKAVAFGKFINPKDYLSEDRIKDIETSMNAFEGKTESTKAVMDSEFQGVSAWENIPDTHKLAMAANIHVSD